MKPPPSLDLATPLYTPTAADWAALRGNRLNPKDESRGGSTKRADTAASTSQSSGAEAAGGAEVERPRATRQAPAGPYYLPSDLNATPPPPAAGAAAGEHQSGIWQATGGPGATSGDAVAAADAAATAASANGGDAAGAVAASGLARFGSYGDEHEAATAVVDLHEDMPDDAKDSDDEQPSASKPAGVIGVGTAPPLPAEPAAQRSGGSAPLLADLLSSDAAPAAPTAGEAGEDSGRRRRRRKHRTSADGSDAPQAPLVDI